MIRMIVTFILTILISTGTVSAGPVVNWGGGGVAEIYAQNGLEFFDDTRIITGDIDPTLTPFNSPNGSIYISTLTNLTYQKQDDGDTTNWNPLYFVPLFTDDNRLVKTDGTNDVQQSGISISDTNAVSGVLSLSTGSATVTGLTEDALAVPDATGLLGSTGVLVNATNDISGVNSISTASAKITGLAEDAIMVPAADGTLESSGVLINAANEISGATSLDVDSVNVDGFTVSTTPLNQSLSLSPNGTGTVDVTYLKDSGSAVFTGINGALLADFPAYRYSTLDQLLYVPGLQSDNVQINGNTVSTTDVNGNLVLDPNGTGEVQVQGFTGGLLMETTATGGLSESTATTADIEGKLDKFAEINDNRIVRTNANGEAVQGSGVTIDDLDAISGLTEATIDNVNIDGNTVSSTSGDLILSPFENLQIGGIDANEVAFANNDGDVSGSADFLYSDATDLLRVGGFDLEAGNLTTYSTDQDLGIEAGGAGEVNITSPTNINDINFTGSSITSAPGNDLTLVGDDTFRVNIEDLQFDSNEMFSEEASPLLITSLSTQPVNVNDVDIQGNNISASEVNDDLELAGDGTGRVKIDRGGTLLEAGSRNPEYVELIDDPSFQAGVSEWTCVNATVAQVTNASPSNLDHGVDRSTTAAKITVTADGGYCEIVKTIGTSQAGTYVPSIYYASSSANAFIEFARDSRARVIDELDFLNTGSYEFLSAQLIASTGLSARLGGNLNDEIWADMASFELGGYPTGQLYGSRLIETKTLSSDATTTGVMTDLTFNNLEIGKKYKFEAVFRPENTTTAAGQKYIGISVNNGATLLDSLQWRLLDIARAIDKLTSSREFTATDTSLTFDLATVSQALVASGITDTRVQLYEVGSSDLAFLPQFNKDARLVVTNEGTTTNVTIGAGTITVPFDTVKPVSQLIDFAGNEATFQKSGEYQVTLEAEVFNTVAAGSNISFFPEVGDGTTFSAFSGDDSRCSTRVLSGKPSAKISCNFLLEASKSDVLRIRALSDDADSTLRSSAEVYPRMIITPLGGRQNIGEFAGTAVFDGESGTLPSGYASFGGATDGSVCSASPCTRYREVGDLADNMSAVRDGTGRYIVTVSGLKPNSIASCTVPNSFLGLSGAVEVGSLNRIGGGSLVNSLGEVTVGLISRTLATDPGDIDTFFSVECKGLRP